MEDITLKEVIKLAFDILEENNAIRYTKKYNREYLIKGYSQDKVKPYIWFGISREDNLGRQINRIIIDKMGKSDGQSWLYHFINITGYKKCSICGKMYEATTKYFYVSKHNLGGLTTDCKVCNNKRRKEYTKNNPEKVIESRKKTYEKKKKEDATYFKRKNALARRRLRQRTPKWLSEEEKIAIQDFYANCPEGYHVDHIIPLNGKLVSGLHVLANLQYLLAHDNSVKSNKYEI